MAIITFEGYREILDFKLKENSRVRGYKTTLAKLLRIPNSYLSHVLSGTNNLSLDQAAILCDFWKFDKTDSDYFITLVSLERSTSPVLREHLQTRLDEMRAQFNRYDALQLKNFSLDIEHALDYLSDWRLPVVHAAVNMPGYGSQEALATRLALSLEEIKTCLSKLAAFGLIEMVAGVWTLKQATIAVNIKMAKNVFHHAMRDKAKSVYQRDDDGIHSSLICTLSKSRYLELKEKIREFIKSVEEDVSAPPEEEVAALLIDYFRFGKG